MELPSEAKALSASVLSESYATIVIRRGDYDAGDLSAIYAIKLYPGNGSLHPNSMIIRGVMTTIHLSRLR